MQEKFGLLSPGKASSISMALHSCFFSCAQCFRVSVIHRTLTSAAGSLKCVYDHAFLCVRIYTRGLGTPTACQHTILTRKKRSHSFPVLRTGFEPRVFGSRVDVLPTEPCDTTTAAFERRRRRMTHDNGSSDSNETHHGHAYTGHCNVCASDFESSNTKVCLRTVPPRTSCKFLKAECSLQLLTSLYMPFSNLSTQNNPRQRAKSTMCFAVALF